MFQLVTVLVSFAAVPILGKFKVNLGLSLIATALIMAVLNGFGLSDIFGVFTGVFTSSSSMNTILVVAVVGIIGTMMKEYGILEKLVNALSSIISDKRYLMMIIPALIGTLTIPGGAILSAPFAFSLGEELNMPKPRRAVSNLVFRHVGMFLLPYSNSLLVASSLSGFSPSTLIFSNLFFCVPMILMGYFIYIRKIPPQISEKTNKQNTSTSIKEIFIYASPIYICIILHIITGLPMYACMLGSLVILYILGPKKGFFQLIFKSIGYKTIISVIGVYMIQGVVTNLDGLINMFSSMFSTGGLMLPALVIGSLFFGLITGFQIAPLSIIIPMLVTLGLGQGQLLAYIYIVYAMAFMGYYYSPLHMCQIFTCEYMGVKIKELYYEYRPFILLVFIYAICSYFVLSKIFPLIFG